MRAHVQELIEQPRQKKRAAQATLRANRRARLEEEPTPDREQREMKQEDDEPKSFRPVNDSLLEKQDENLDEGPFSEQHAKRPKQEQQANDAEESEAGQSAAHRLVSSLPLI